MTCPRCGDRGYLVGRDGELAKAEVCECKRECKTCKGARYIIAKEGPYEVARPCDCAGLMARVRLYNDAQIPAGYADKSLVPSGPNDPHGFVHRDIESLKRAKAAVSRYSMSLDVSVAGDHASQGLVLMGGYGLGKTHLVCGLLSTLTLKRGIACRFVDYYTLLSRIRATFDKGGDRERTTDTEQSLIDPLVEVPVLVIDDLGKGQGSHWELTILDQIVTRRYNARRIIIATTNYLLEKDLEQVGHHPASGAQGALRRGRRTGESLEERIGERLVSRLHASCDMLLLDGSDYRVSGPRASR